MRCVGLRQVMRARDTIHRGGIIGMAREHGNAMGFSEAGRLYGKMFQDSLDSVTLVRYKVRILHGCTRGTQRPHSSILAISSDRRAAARRFAASNFYKKKCKDHIDSVTLV
jgi:hypothetical protein